MKLDTLSLDSQNSRFECAKKRKVTYLKKFHIASDFPMYILVYVLRYVVWIHFLVFSKGKNWKHYVEACKTRPKAIQEIKKVGHLAARDT